MSQPKKIKIDYSDINLDDYMDINLKEYRNYIYTQIDDLQSQINSFNNILYKIDKCVHKKCEKQNNGHEWIRMRDSGPYGERYTVCKNCNLYK